MRLFLLVLLAMTAFAANSLLNRIGVGQFGMDPMWFASLRVFAGAAALVLICVLGRRPLPLRLTPRRIGGALSLSIYMIGFSLAYLVLGAGIGALILFGVVQIGILGWAALRDGRLASGVLLGGIVAFAGLMVLLWPQGTGPTLSLGGAVAMIAAGLGWAAHTVLGQSETNALGATAANFIYCLPLVGLTTIIGAGQAIFPIGGAVAAILAGAITSGLGHALWYRVLPQLQTVHAGIAQLSVPVIAVAGGAVALGEAVTPRLIVAALLVLGGIALSLRAKAA